MPSSAVDVRLRPPAREDLERLRLWRNARASAFFDSREISPERQRAWFDAYLKKADEPLFIVEAGEPPRPCGCLGARIRGAEAELYNVLAAPERVPGAMTAAVDALSAVLRTDFSVSTLLARVLRGNPALAFYLRLGFAPRAEHPDHVELARPA